MIQLSYISRACQPMSAEALLELLQHCKSKNTERGITGLLLYGNETFLQALEGDDAAIDALVETISHDPRHTDLQILGRRPIDQRQYAHWSMGFERVSESGLTAVEGLDDFDERDFNVDYLTEHKAVADSLMEHYRKPHWDPLIRELDAKDKVIECLEQLLADSRGSVALAKLVLESVLEASRGERLTDSHRKICESALNALRQA